jgi:hypothetical protein
MAFFKLFSCLKNIPQLTVVFRELENVKASSTLEG